MKGLSEGSRPRGSTLPRRREMVRLAPQVMAISSSPMQTLSPLPEIEAIAKEIDEIVPATPQFSWPLLNQRTGCELWVKHENHTAIGSFKIRGAVNYVGRLVSREPGVRGIVAATRGNFGQSLAFAAKRHGLTATIVVPHGNSA